MTDIEAIKRAVELLPQLRDSDRVWNDFPVSMKGEHKVILAALSALAPVAEGKAAIVPVEPTAGMMGAGYGYIGKRDRRLVTEGWLAGAYRAMIGARG